MEFLKKNSFILILFLGFLTFFLPFLVQNFGFLSPDSLKIVLGADFLVRNGAFRENIEDYGGFLSENLSIGAYYPFIQLIVSSVSQLFSLPIEIAFIFLMFFCLTIFSVGLFFVLRRVYLTGGVEWYLAPLFLIGFFFSPSIVRAFLLTPQNFLGYFVLVFGVICFLYFFSKKRYFFTICFLLCFFPLLFFVHYLSFGYFLFSVLIFFHFLLVIKKRQWFFILIFLELLLLVFAMFFFSDFVIGILSSGLSFESIESKNVVNVRYLFSALGAPLLLVSLFGIFDARKYFNEYVCLFLGSYTFLGLLFSLFLPLFGYVFLPDRFVMFLWLPIVLFFPLGFSFLLRKNKIYFGKFLSKLIGLLAVVLVVFQAFFWMFDDITVFSKRFSHISDIENLVGHIPDSSSRVMYSLRGSDQSAMSLPLFLENDVIVVPESSLYAFPFVESEEDTRRLEEVDTAAGSLRLAWVLGNYPDVDFVQRYLSINDVDYYIVGNDRRLRQRIDESDFWIMKKESGNFVLYERKK